MPLLVLMVLPWVVQMLTAHRARVLDRKRPPPGHWMLYTLQDLDRGCKNIAVFVLSFSNDQLYIGKPLFEGEDGLGRRESLTKREIPLKTSTMDLQDAEGILGPLHQAHHGTVERHGRKPTLTVILTLFPAIRCIDPATDQVQISKA